MKKRIVTNTGLLTKWEERVLTATMQFIQAHNFSPTRRELAVSLRIKPPEKGIARVHAALSSLQRKGYIKKKKASWRNITIIKNEHE